MSNFFRSWLLFAASLSVWGVAHSGSSGWVQADPQATLQVSAPGTPVAAVAYRSVFDGLPSGVEQSVVDWKSANAAVGQFTRGYMDVLKWEADQSGKPAMPEGHAMPCCKQAQP
jgi:hypothetical protein